jgi:hypothetical protein
MNRLLAVCLLISFCATVSCARVQGAQGTEGSGDSLSGTWVGDFGPAFYDRNTISLELKWDGKNLTGMVKPGVPGARMYRNFEGFPISNASFDPGTGLIKFEAMYQPRGRRYLIEGKIKGDTFNGTWNRPEENKDGDFKLTRKSSD